MLFNIRRKVGLFVAINDKNYEIYGFSYYLTCDKYIIISMINVFAILLYLHITLFPGQKRYFT